MIRRNALWATAASVVFAAGCSAGGTIAAVGEPTPVAGGESSAAAPTGGRMSVSSLRQATESAATATSGRFEMTVRMSGGGDGDMSMTTTGAFAGDRSQFSTSMNVSGAADEPIPGLGSAGDLMDNEMITIGSDTYVRGGVFSMFAGGAGEGEPQWVRIPGDGMAGDELGAQMASPDELRELLNGAFGDVSELGAQDVRGVPTTHYRVAIDPEQVLGSVADLAPGELSPGDVGALDDLVLDVFVDADGIARRVTFAPSIEGMSFEMTLDYFDLGADIAIDAPSDFREFDPATAFGGLGEAFDELMNEFNSAD